MENVHIMGHCRDNSEVSKPARRHSMAQPPTAGAASGRKHTRALIHLIHHIRCLIEERGSAMDPPSPTCSPIARLYSTR